MSDLGELECSGEFAASLVHDLSLLDPHILKEIPEPGRIDISEIDPISVQVSAQRNPVLVQDRINILFDDG
jgi:hypothetical protein